MNTTRRAWRAGFRIGLTGLLGAGVMAGGILAGSGPAAAIRVGDSIGAGTAVGCYVQGGVLFCWGDNLYGQLGDGTTTDRHGPTAVSTSGVLNDRVVARVAGGEGHTCALADGRVYCWGHNDHGQLGDGTTTDRRVPVPVDTSGVLAGVDIATITAARSHTCALSEANVAYCWGENTDGELGDGTTTDRHAPVAVSPGTMPPGASVHALATGDRHTCAVTGAGAAYCWGYNGNGQLGDGTTTARTTPVAVYAGGVLSGLSVSDISPGGAHTCARASDDRAYCWGLNLSGQLGDGTSVEEHAPVAVDTTGVLSGLSLNAILARGNHSCALSAAALAYCWGDNDFGQLGDGTTGNRNVPVAVDTSGALFGVHVTQIDGGPRHTCALSDADRVYCWGQDSDGQIGDGSTIGQNSPTATLLAPGAPTAVGATGGDGVLVVFWTPPAEMGTGTFVRYTAVATPGGNLCTSTAYPYCTISGLHNGTAYTVQVVATNTEGSSEPSDPSQPTVPASPAPPARAHQVPVVPDCSRLSADFNGDGHDDIGLFYDYGHGDVALWTMTEQPGGFAAPVQRWRQTLGQGVRFVTTGDFAEDGTHTDDVAIFYDSGAGQIDLYVLYASPARDGTFTGGVQRWNAPWSDGTAFVNAGDFTADGRTEIAIWYRYSATHLALYTMAPNASGDGDFDAPVLRWDGTAWGAGTRFTAAGDYNGDGRTDLAAYYDYGGGHLGLWTWASTPDGGFAAPVLRWDAPDWGTGTTRVASIHSTTRSTIDLALFYDYGGGHVALWTMVASPLYDGTFADPVLSWDAPGWGSGTRFVIAGNYFHSGGDDIALLYDYGAGHVALWTLSPPPHEGPYPVPPYSPPVIQWNSATWGSGTHTMF